MEALLRPEGFAAYRRFRAANPNVNYTEPFVPCVGETYFTSGLPKLVYCGAAIWERKLVQYDYTDDAAYFQSKEFTETFLEGVAGGAKYSSAFWRLFSAASEIVHGADVPPARRVKAAVWTYLSKLGQEAQSEPINKADLRALDVSQLKAELEVLKPDLFLCVSGEMLTETGNELFESLPRVDGVTLATESSLLKRLPAGGFLLWTNHPQRKSATWFQSMLADIQFVMGMLNIR